MNAGSELHMKILRACAGEVVTGLPYGSPAMAQAERDLRRDGLIETGLDNDQPTSRATHKGLDLLARGGGVAGFVCASTPGECNMNPSVAFRRSTDIEIALRGAARDAFAEAMRATEQWPPMNSAHEAYAVLLEEVDELWAHVKTNQKRRDLQAMRAEAIQVAAVALRFVVDVCNKDRGRK